MVLVVVALVAGVSGVLLLDQRRSPSPPPGQASAPPTPTWTGAPSLAPGEPDVPDRPHDRRPNIVMVMADDMRTDDLRFMPTVRRVLQRHGVELENSFSPDPLCCPARASFLSGEYSHNHGVLSHEHPWGYQAFDDSYTMATALHDAGYSTGFVGKYLNGYGHDVSKVTGGPSLRYVPPGWTDWYASLEPPPGSPYTGNTYNYRHLTYNHNGVIDDGHRGEYSTYGVSRISRRLVTSYAAKRRPFFLYASFIAPHFGGPREPDDPVRYLRKARDLSKYRTPARPAWVKGRFDAAIPRGAGVPPSGITEADVSDKPRWVRHRPELDRVHLRAMRDVTRQRAESLFVLDREVGRIVATLKRTGAWGNTVLMFTSDNGYYLGEHRRDPGKIHGHEPSLRVPFLLTGPGLRDGSTRYDPISTVDATATILDLGRATDGLLAHHAIDGRSLVPALRDGDRGWTVPVVSEGRESGERNRAGRSGLGFHDARTYVGLRTGQYSLLVYDTGELELYDLATDPNELTSVHADPAYATVRQELLDLWWQYKDCRGDACRVPLPADLQTSPERTGVITRSFWRGVDRWSGHGHGG